MHNVIISSASALYNINIQSKLQVKSHRIFITDKVATRAQQKHTYKCGSRIKGEKRFFHESILSCIIFFLFETDKYEMHSRCNSHHQDVKVSLLKRRINYYKLVERETCVAIT